MKKSKLRSVGLDGLLRCEIAIGLGAKSMDKMQIKIFRGCKCKMHFFFKPKEVVAKSRPP
jgi:hypothetical protein